MKPQILEIVKWPAEILTQKAARITTIDDRLKCFAAVMIHRMRKNGGCGLAAPQVGRSIEMFVVDAPQLIHDKVFINPVVLSVGDETDVQNEWMPQCAPVVELPIRRAKRIWVMARDLDWKLIDFQCEGLLSPYNPTRVRSSSGYNDNGSGG